MSHSVTTEKLRDFVSKSLTKVLKTMFWAECELIGFESCSGTRSLSPKLDPEKDGSSRMFAASDGFAGDLNGVCYLFLDDAFAYYIANIITGIDLEKLEEDTVRDVCGELTNMFAGTFRNTLADLGLPSTLTIPTVMQGKRMAISTVGTSSQTRFAFEVDGYRGQADLILTNN